MKNHLISIILGCMVLLCALAGCQSDESPEASVSVPPTNPTTNIPVESNAVQSDSVKSDYPKSVEEGILTRQDIQRIYYLSFRIFSIWHNDDKKSRRIQ